MDNLRETLLTPEQKKLLHSAINGILLADHMRDVARQMPKLFELAGIPIQEFESFEEVYPEVEPYLTDDN